MKRSKWDPVACLRQLAAHKQAFHIGDSSALMHFTALIGAAESCTIECSCKIEGARVHPARFNLWFQQAASERQLTAALRFFDRVESDEGGALDYGLFRRFCTTDFDWSKIDVFVVGVDLRERMSESRLKIWFKLGDYPAKEEGSLFLSGASSGLRPLIVRHGVLVGFDFYLNGRTAIEVYPRIEKADLQDSAIRARLMGVLAPRALALLDSCDWAHVSLATEAGGRILHCRPADPRTFVANFVGNDLVSRIVDQYSHEQVLDTVVSLREEEYLASHTQNVNVYFMLGERA